MEYFRPLPGTVPASRIRQLGFRPLHVTVKRAAGPGTSPPYSGDTAEPQLESSFGSCKNTHPYNCVEGGGWFVELRSDGSAIYRAQTETSDPIVATMTVVLRAADEEGVFYSNSFYSNSRPSPGPGFWQFDERFPRCRRGYVEGLSYRLANEADGSSLPGWDRDNDNEFQCPNREGGTSEGGAERLDTTEGPAGDWMCEEFELDPGIWHVYIDGIYAGTIECEA